MTEVKNNPNNAEPKIADTLHETGVAAASVVGSEKLAQHLQASRDAANDGNYIKAKIHAVASAVELARTAKKLGVPGLPDIPDIVPPLKTPSAPTDGAPALPNRK